jgi:hypothetical protein
MEKKILVDGNETTLREFIHANTEQEDQISLEELLQVINAKPGDKFYSGMVEIEIL